MKQFRVTNEGDIQTTLRGLEVLSVPFLNKGVAFTEEERKELGLKGFLPPKVLTIDDQAKRAYEQYSAQPDDLSKNVYLTALHDRNETLFYRLLNDHLGKCSRLSIHRQLERQSRDTAMNTENHEGSICQSMTRTV